MYENVKKILPEIELAEHKFYHEDFDKIETNDDYIAAVQRFNEILEKAIDAIYEDTKNVNSKSTIQQVYRGREKTDTHFGVSPTNVIKNIIRDSNN
jgi:hypothetical protein